MCDNPWTQQDAVCDADSLRVRVCAVIKRMQDLGNKVCSEACMFDNAGLEPFMAIIGLVDDFS